MNVRYEDYKQFGADTKITFGDPVSEAKPQQPKPEQPKPDPPKKQ